MFTKIAAFFRSFFTNAKSDPVSTSKGIVQLAAAGATAYGMATGKVPVNEMTVGFATATTASGLHAIGSDTAAAAVVNTAQSVAERYQTIKADVATAQAVIDAASNGVAELAEVVPLGVERKAN